MPVEDRVLPHNLEAERSILGAILLHGDVIHLVASILDGSEFYREAHRLIFDVMVRMPASAIDMVTIREALERKNKLDEVGGPAYISALIDGVPRSTNVEYYAKIIKDHSVRRGVIFASSKAMATAYAAGEDPPALIIDSCFSDLLALSTHATGQGLVRVSETLPRALDQLDQLSKPDSIAWGFRSGISALDRKIRGFRPGKMIVIAGRPGDGKTSLALNVATSIAKGQHAVGVFSLEQDTDELMLQLISSEAEVNIEDLADGRLDQDDWSRVTKAYSTFNEIPLYIDPSTDINPITLRAKSRRIQIERGLSAVIVDYVQLMGGLPTSKRNENEHEKLTGVSRAIKLLAKDMAVPIVVCCQLNRAPDARQDGRPLLSDLRGSGSLEQDADTVILIHDPSKAPKRKVFRKKGAIPEAAEQAIVKGVVELIIAKNRGLSTGIVQVLFEKRHTRFKDLAF